MPTIAITIGGVVYNEADAIAAGLAAFRLTAHRRGGPPTLEFARKIGGLRAGPDPWLGKSVELEIDGVLRFAGDIVEAAEPFDERLGYTQVYRCTDLRMRVDRVPVTDPNTGTDQLVFNLPSDDPRHLPSRAGRNTGEIVRFALEVPATAEALDALGVGNYTGPGGFGAAAQSDATGATLTVTDGGSGYDSVNPPTVLLIAADGRTAVGSATVTGDEVTAASGPGTLSGTPQVWISPLPPDTLRDLAALDTIVPHPAFLAGESVLNSVDGLVRTANPNINLSVLADGTIRLVDGRTHAGPLVRITGDGTGATARAVVDSAGEVTSIEPIDGGTGYTSATVELIGGGGSGATATATISGGAITGYTVSNGGSGYRYARTLTLGVDPVYPPSLQASVREAFTRVVVRGAAENEMVELRLSEGDLEEAFAHSGLDNEEAIDAWTIDDFLDPSAGPEVNRATATASIASGAVTGITVTSGGGGYKPSTNYNVSVTGGGGTGAAGYVTSDASGVIVGPGVVTSGGSGYTSAPTVSVPGPSGPSRSEGTCTCTTTTVTVTPSDPAQSWGENAWDAAGRQGRVFLRYPAGTGIAALVSRNVVSNTALSPGGTSVLTVDRALPATNYTQYTLTGTGGGASEVWRTYSVTDPEIAARMQRLASEPFPLVFADGSAARMTSTPTLVVNYSSSGDPPYQEYFIGSTVDPDSGTVTADKPVVIPFNSDADLQSGGADVVPPSDVRLYVPIAKGTLEAVWPPDDSADSPVFAGTAHAWHAIAKTLTIAVNDWRDPGQLSNMLDYARDHHGSVCDVVTEGNIRYYGYSADLLSPFLALNLAASDYLTGHESAALAVIECELSWAGAAGGTVFATTLSVSNRRSPYGGPVMLEPEPTGWMLGGAFEGTLGGMIRGGGGIGLPERTPVTLGPGAQQWMGAMQQGAQAAAGEYGRRIAMGWRRPAQQQQQPPSQSESPARRGESLGYTLRMAPRRAAKAIGDFMSRARPAAEKLANPPRTPQHVRDMIAQQDRKQAARMGEPDIQARMDQRLARDTAQQAQARDLIARQDQRPRPDALGAEQMARAQQPGTMDPDMQTRMQERAERDRAQQAEAQAMIDQRNREEQERERERLARLQRERGG